MNVSSRPVNHATRASAPTETRTRRAVAKRSGFPLFDTVMSLATGKYVSSKQLMVLTSQLSTMLGAGCDLCNALDSLARQQTHPYLKAVMLDLTDSVQAGQAFSQALAEHPDVFSPIYITMIRAGESAGMLRAMLAGLQTMMRNQLRVTSAVRGALMYPAILSMVACSAIVVMTSFVLPKFAAVFKSSNAPLPAITSFMLNGSEFVGRNFIWLSLGFFSIAVFIAWLLSRPFIRPNAHGWILRFPLVGPTLRISYVVRAIQTIGMLLKSGLPVADALVLVGDLMPNIHYRRFFDTLHDHITEGKQLAPDFEQTTLFPPMVSQMIAVGEDTGTLPVVCAEVASLHEEEMHERIKILTTALEPAIIIILGGFVGLIAISVILPMFRIGSALK